MTMGWKRCEESTGNDIERFDAKNQFEVFVWMKDTCQYARYINKNFKALLKQKLENIFTFLKVKKKTYYFEIQIQIMNS